jgi:hypothetical protein
MKTPKPGTVYVAVQPDRGSVKVGCTMSGSRRLEMLSRYGWVLHRELYVVSTDLARAIEQAALFDLRHRLLVPVHLTAEDLPNGWTETASASLVSAPQMWHLVGDHAGAAYLAPVVRKVPGRRGPKTPPTPPRRVAGDTPSYSRAARAAAAYTAKNAK